MISFSFLSFEKDAVGIFWNICHQYIIFLLLVFLKLVNSNSECVVQMSDDNPYVIPEMEPTLRKQIQESNWQVVNVTTRANYFHVPRRQASISL